MGVFIVGNLAASFSTKISEVVIFRGPLRAAAMRFDLLTGLFSFIIRIRGGGWRWYRFASTDCNVRRCQPSGQVCLLLIKHTRTYVFIRGKYQGIIGVVVAFGNGIGPLIGGTLAEKTSWQWCFRVTLPLAICGILVVIYVLPLKTVSGNAKQYVLFPFLMSRNENVPQEIDDS